MRIKRSEAGKMPCDVLHYFGLNSEAKKIERAMELLWKLEVQYLLKYRVGLNLLYLKTGEIRSVCNAARIRVQGNYVCYSIPD